jgi:SAM-dependent methyltransferase
MKQTIRKLHIGAFDQIFDGWVNTDITPHIFVARAPMMAKLLFKFGIISEERFQQHAQGLFRSLTYMNVCKNFPFHDGTFDFVYTSHLLEHLYPDDSLQCLKEVFRVLNKGGGIRIAVPDLDDLVRSYNPLESDSFLEIFFEGRQKSDKNRHHWHYNYTNLAAVLKQVGFTEISRCEFKKGSCPDLDRYEKRPESLFVEAKK